MTFGPNSNNPRERRSYAFAMLAKARASSETADLEAAQTAVRAAGTSRKSRGHNFVASLFNIAMRDETTNYIVDQSRLMIDPATSFKDLSIAEQRGRDFPWPPYSETIIRIADLEPGNFIHLATGFTFDRSEDRMRPRDLELDAKFTDSESGEKTYPRHDIPLRHEIDDIDAVAVRLMPDEVRTHMAALIEQFVTIRS